MRDQLLFLWDFIRDRLWIVAAELLFALARLGVSWWEAWFERTHAGGG